MPKASARPELQGLSPVKRKLMVIGIGPGDPSCVTVQAIEAMNGTDVFFVPDKGTEKADLAPLPSRDPRSLRARQDVSDG